MRGPSAKTAPGTPRALAWLAALTGGLPGLLFFSLWVGGQGWRGELSLVLPTASLVAGLGGVATLVGVHTAGRRSRRALTAAGAILLAIAGSVTWQVLLGLPYLVGAIFAFGACLDDPRGARRGH